MMCACGRPESEHAIILYAGGPEALPEATGEAAVKARSLTPVVWDTPSVPRPAVARTAGGPTARRLTASQAVAVKAWRKLADQQKGKRA